MNRSTIRRTTTRALAVAVIVALGAGPAAADRDRALAGALILGAVGLAIANAQQAPVPGVQRQRTGLAQAPGPGVRSTGQIAAPIHITPARPLYTGPGGVPPGTRSDPLAGLGPQQWRPESANAVRAIPPTGAVSDATVLTPLARPRVPDILPPDPIYPVTVTPLPPVGQPAPAVVAGRVLPARCLSTYDQEGDNLSLYAPDCLATATNFAADLPLSCARTLRTLGRFVSGYEPACLVSAGYRVAGQRSP